MKIAKGQMVAITSGEYSDYCLRDHMRAVRDFDSDAEKARFKSDGDYLVAPDWDKTGDASEYESDDRFLAWCIREGLLEPTESDAVVELWIGAYGRLQ